MSRPWFKFYPSDWRSDLGLRRCSPAARGLWIDMLCIMHEATPRGYLTIGGVPLADRDLAALLAISPKQCAGLLAELEKGGVFSRTDAGVIFSRRMIRDEAKQAKNEENGHLGGNPSLRRGTVPKEERVRPYKRSDAPQKTRRIFERAEGRCRWCNVELLLEGEGGEPNLFHIDYITPICDGGTNAEDNLVAACAECKRERARLKGGTAPPVNGGCASDVMVGRNSDTNSDSKAQKPEARIQKEAAQSVEEVSRARAPDIDLDALLARLLAIAKPGSWPLATCASLVPIPRLLAEGADLERDVIPVVATLADAARRSGKKISAWSYFEKAIREARDARLAGTASPSATAPPPMQRLAGTPEDWPPQIQLTPDDAFAWWKARRWPMAFGPKPGEAGCLVPKRIQDEWASRERGEAA